MFEESNEIKIFTTTLKDVIENLSNIKDLPLEDFQEEVCEAFDGYEYDDVDEIVGFENWPDISNDGDYELNVKIDHEYAYELTLYTVTKGSKVTIKNVL